MDIQIHDASGDYSVNGTKLLTSIHDKSSILEMFVRESIQNSIDAALTDAASINVDFFHGRFEHSCLSSELEGLNQTFYERYSGEQQFIAVKDYNTTGLTGKFLKTDPGETGNLRKLIFEFRESKQKDGQTGGSWGLGKTVFSRLGIGIVIYYSRIRKESGEFESRLLAALIEDETSDTRISPFYNGTCSGIAWWGSSSQTIQNKIAPITDEQFIKDFLHIFGLNPYSESETGTTVIVPYVDFAALLDEERARQNASDRGDGLSVSGTETYRQWLNSITDYLKHIIVKWYYPRLDNKSFRYGMPLTATITDLTKNYNQTIPVSMNTAKGVFKLMQALYNRAAWNNYMPEGYRDYIMDNLPEVTQVGVEIISIQEQREAGYIAYLKMTVNGLANFGQPDLFIGEKGAHTFLSFTRSLGMIVWYEPVKITSVSDSVDEFIFGQFVLNSRANISGMPVNLETYIRQTEGPSHNSWDVEDRTIAKRIKDHCRDTFKSAFSPKQVQIEEGKNPLGRYLRNTLSPQSRRNNTGPRDSRSVSNRYFSSKLDAVSYSPSFTLTYSLTMNTKCAYITYDVLIANDGKPITLKDYRQGVSKTLPFQISSATLKVNSSQIGVDEDNPINTIEDKTSKYAVALEYDDMDYSWIKVIPKFEVTATIKEISAILTIEFIIIDMTIMPQVDINGVKI